MVCASDNLKAHSWYDPDCCGGQDCAPVTSITYVASELGKTPVMVVTTKFGTKALRDDTKIRASKDNQMHACIYQGNLICLYLPPSN